MESGDQDPQQLQNGENNPAASVINANQSEATILQLSIDVLLQIIQFLPMAQWASLENVNRSFQEATHQVWRMVRKVQMDKDLLVKRSQENTEKTHLLNSLWRSRIYERRTLRR